MLPWVPAAIGGFASLFGGKRANVTSARQAQKQMDFQERMSSTAHQREVQDLRAAGLNPILSATGGRGAAAPGGAQAIQRDIASPAVSSALALRTQKQDLINLRSLNEKIHADTASARAQAAESAARAKVQTNVSRISSAPAVVGDVLGSMAEHIRRNFGRIGSSAADFTRVRTPRGSNIPFELLNTPVGTKTGPGRRSE